MNESIHVEDCIGISKIECVKFEHHYSHGYIQLYERPFKYATFLSVVASYTVISTTFIFLNVNFFLPNVWVKIQTQ